MSMTTTRRAGRALTVLLASVFAVLLALATSPAHASVSVSPAGPYADGQVVTVSGTAPASAASATHVTLTVCNAAVTPGTRCDATNATGFETVAAYGAGVDLTLDKSFADFNFTGGAGPAPTGTTTTCRGTSGSPCAVVVSYYNGSGATATQLGAELLSITFS